MYAALSAGASGFLLKDVSPEQLAAAVRLVRFGDALLAPSITRRLVERFAFPPEPATSPHSNLAALTPRELEVLRALAMGLSNAELAALFHLSEATVKPISPGSSPSSTSATAPKPSSSPTRPD